MGSGLCFLLATGCYPPHSLLGVPSFLGRLYAFFLVSGFVSPLLSFWRLDAWSLSALSPRMALGDGVTTECHSSQPITAFWALADVAGMLTRAHKLNHKTVYPAKKLQLWFLCQECVNRVILLSSLLAEFKMRTEGETEACREIKQGLGEQLLVHHCLLVMSNWKECEFDFACSWLLANQNHGLHTELRKMPNSLLIKYLLQSLILFSQELPYAICPRGQTEVLYPSLNYSCRSAWKQLALWLQLERWLAGLLWGLLWLAMRGGQQEYWLPNYFCY